MVILTPGFPSSCHGENRPKVRVNTGVVKFYVDEEREKEGREETGSCRGFTLDQSVWVH